MKAKELLCEGSALHHKLLRKSDLIEYIKSNVDSTSNYSVLLGAGCSVTSEIDSGRDLVNKWIKEIYEITDSPELKSSKELLDYFIKNQTSWFNSANPYASLFEKKYDLASQRRRFVESMVNGKLPSIGYAYLIDLVNKGHLSTFFTTNFDDLLQEAVYQFSAKRPIMCAHDSSVQSISITSTRPKIIKLHGDYLFDDIKSTLRETESLEQNIKEKLIHFCKEFGLIVIGYSGNDRSIMDVIEFLTKQDNYLSNGLYWCLREGDEVNSTLEKLLWRDRVYPIFVDGFDEFFAATHNGIVSGGLGIESNLNQPKIKKTVGFMMSDSHGLFKDKIIKKELDRLKSMDRQIEISNFITDISSDKDVSSSLPISDYRNLLEIGSFIAKKDFKKAKNLAEDDFNQSSSDTAKPQYLLKLISLSALLGDKRDAIKWCDKLYEIDPNNISYLMEKSKYLDLDDRIKYIKGLKNKFPRKYTVSNKYASELLNNLRHRPSVAEEVKGEILESLDLSLSLEPSLSNYGWQLKYSALSNVFIKKSNDDVDLELKDHVQNANKLNPRHITCLKLRANYASKKRDCDSAIRLIGDLYEEYETSSKERMRELNSILSDIHSNLFEFTDKKICLPMMKKFYEVHLKENSIEKDPILNLDKAKYYIGQNKNIIKSKDYFEIALESSNFLEALPYALTLIDCFGGEYINRVKSLFETYRYEFEEKIYFEAMSEISAFDGNYEAALGYIHKSYDAGLSLSVFLCRYSYICLLGRQYDLIIEIHKKFPNFDNSENFEAWKLNYTYALKENNMEYSDVTIRNLSAQSKNEAIKLAAFAVLGNDDTVKRMVRSEINKDFMNYFKFIKWPILEGVKQTIIDEFPLNYLPELNHKT